MKLGQVVAIVVDNKEDVEKFKDYTNAPAPADEAKRSCPAKMERPVSTPEPNFPGAGVKKIAPIPVTEKKVEPKQAAPA